MLARNIFTARHGTRYMGINSLRLFSSQQGDSKAAEHVVKDEDIIGDDKIKAAQQSIAEKLKQIKQ